MNEEVLRAVVTSGFIIVIFMLLDYKAKNYISEKQNILFILVTIIVLRIVNITFKENVYEIYVVAIVLLIPTALLGGYLILQKNKTFFFKGIDKKLINENKNEIVKIIEDYKNNYVDYKSDITFMNNKIVFEKVKKQQIQECLSLVGEFLDKNRKKYTFINYLIYYTKSLVVPFIIAVTVALLLIKLTRQII